MNRSDAYGSPRRPYTMLVQCVTNATNGFEWHGPWMVATVHPRLGRWARLRLRLGIRSKP